MLAPTKPGVKAVMVVEPEATPVASPVLRPTTATDVLDELQVVCAVKSKVVPSEYVPKALNC